MMALVNCPECKKQVSDNANSCPDCGYDIKAHFQRLREKEEEKKHIQQEEKYKQERMNSISMPEKPKYPRWAILAAAISGLIGFISYITTNEHDRAESIAHGNGDSNFGSIYLMISAVVLLIIGYYLYQKKVSDYLIASKDFERYKQIITKREEEQERQSEYQAKQEALLHPKCPNCGSYDTKKISNTSRITSVATIGLASGKIGKQYKCKKCGHMW